MQTSSIPDSDVYLSVIAAAYNESANLPTLLKEIAAALGQLERSWEILIINDSSTDETEQVLREQMKQYPILRVLSLNPHSGQTAAIEAGVRRARGRFLATLDADLQNDPADIPNLLACVTSGRCDLANGRRVQRKDPWLRRISTRTANKIRNMLTRENINDSACGLKVFRRECTASLKFFNGLHRFLPTLVKMEGFQVLEVPVNHRPRVAGKAKYGVWNRMFRALRDTLAVRWMQNRLLRYQVEEWRRSDVG
jgi:dolichol-phosphate mannosyltransferase